MLEQRLREMRAIENARLLVRSPQMINGVIETFRQTPQGVGVMFSDPGGTIMRAPKGFQRMASNLQNPQNFRAGGTLNNFVLQAIESDQTSLVERVARQPGLR